jgi:hypothetical protein
MSTEAKDVDMADATTTETVEEVSKHTQDIVAVVVATVGRTLCSTVNSMPCNSTRLGEQRMHHALSPAVLGVCCFPFVS